MKKKTQPEHTGERVMEGRIGSDGWAFCSISHWVREPIFPYTYWDMDGKVTAYYCREHHMVFSDFFKDTYKVSLVKRIWRAFRKGENDA